MNWVKNVNCSLASFLVVFLFLMASAGAEVYLQCPDGAIVDDSWWNPVACEGGVYGFGSLYLKWATAPFNNGSTEASSVKLTLRTGSRGTPMHIYVWNGYGWNAVSGGVIDFNGDYVYDLTGMPGPYMDNSMRIKIFNDGPEDMWIDQAKLSIEYASRMRTLSIEVRDCDGNRREENVDIEVDGVRKDTDSEGKVQFTLAKDKIYVVEVDDKDYYEKSVSVYMDGDEEIEFCVIKREIAEIDVQDLEVEDDVIGFKIKNKGNIDDDASYQVTVDGEIVSEGTIFLERGEDVDIGGSYDFQPGSHKVKARAEMRGYADSESLTYCVEGETQNYRCSGNNVVRETVLSGCVSRWDFYEQCDEDCYGGVCVPFGFVPDVTDGECKAGITSLVYDDHVVASQLETFSVRVKNEGSGNRVVYAKIYVDNILKERKYVSLSEGKSSVVHFQLRLAQGSRLVRIEVLACGMVSDSLTESIKVLSSGKIVHDVDGEKPVGPDVPVSPEPEPDYGMSMEASPGVVNMIPCGGASIKVTINSFMESEYRISVTGMDKDWVDYPDRVVVWGHKDVFVFASPQKEGEYVLNIRVWNDDVSDHEEVRFFVSEDASLAVGGASAGGVTGGGVAADDGEMKWLLFAFVGIATAMVFVFILNRYFTHQKVYDFGLLEEYDRDIRRASLS